MTVGDLDTVIPLRCGMEVLIPLNGATLDACLSVPQHSSGIVVFAHGSGSGRLSPRNHFVADVLNQHGMATLLADLLTAEEIREDEKSRQLRFNISLLADRLSGIVQWVKRHSKIGHKPIGLFGASTGAAAALMVAAQYPDLIMAVVSRGGRPDLAGSMLRTVSAPTLLIVGGHDREVLGLNQMALLELNRYSRLKRIPGATHLFEEAGALETVSQFAAEWFEHHLKGEEATYAAS